MVFYTTTESDESEIGERILTLQKNNPSVKIDIFDIITQRESRPVIIVVSENPLYTRFDFTDHRHSEPHRLWIPEGRTIIDGPPVIQPFYTTCVMYGDQLGSRIKNIQDLNPGVKVFKITPCHDQLLVVLVSASFLITDYDECAHSNWSPVGNLPPPYVEPKP
jgi:hypothetical protein